MGRLLGICRKFYPPDTALPGRPYELSGGSV